MTDQNSRSWPIATDLDADHFSGVALSLVDLHRARLRKAQMVITGVTFENCRIEGPAVMLPIGNCTFDATDFGYAAGDIRKLVLRPASSEGVIGAIPMRDCSFKHCELFAIGYTGADAFLDQILALGGAAR